MNCGVPGVSPSETKRAPGSSTGSSTAHPRSSKPLDATWVPSGACRAKIKGAPQSPPVSAATVWHSDTAVEKQSMSPAGRAAVIHSPFAGWAVAQLSLGSDSPSPSFALVLILALGLVPMSYIVVLAVPVVFVALAIPVVAVLLALALLNLRLLLIKGPC